MITIFTVPRSFEGEFDIIQKNAISSWARLFPKCEIILFGNEKGTKEIAAELGVRHIPEVKRNKFGTPVLGWTFNQTLKIAKNNLIAAVCGDIILMNDFVEAASRIIKIQRDKPFLMVGQRHNLEIGGKIDFDDPDWEKDLRDRVAKETKLYGLSAIDYFVFPKDFRNQFPPFIIGAPGWDNWMICDARSRRIPVIDATKVVTIVHQNHSRPRREKDFFKFEQDYNFELAGGLTKMMNLLDANYVLTNKGLERPEFPRNIFSKLSLFYPLRLVLAFRRKIREILNV